MTVGDFWSPLVLRNLEVCLSASPNHEAGSNRATNIRSWAAEHGREIENDALSLSLWAKEGRELMMTSGLSFSLVSRFVVDLTSETNNLTDPVLVYSTFEPLTCSSHFLCGRWKSIIWLFQGMGTVGWAFSGTTFVMICLGGKPILTKVGCPQNRVRFAWLYLWASNVFSFLCGWWL